MAGRQDGVVSTAQLLALEMSRAQIHTASGAWLHPLYQGVWSVGTPQVTTRGRCRAVLLALGEDAAISHQWAAALRGLRKDFPGMPEATTSRHKKPRAGIRVYRRALPAHDVVLFEGIRVTSVARTIFDIAADHGRDEAERAINEAQFLRLFDPSTIPRLLQAQKGRPGAATMRAIWLHGDFAITQAELERRFRKFLKKYRLPLPETNVEMVLAGRRIVPDCVWRKQKLIVELDGGAAHRTETRFHGDRRRDRKLGRDGWTVWRVTWQHLRDEPDDLAADLRWRLAQSPGD